ncbi:MAG: hypothetical protein HY675_17920 [Chloroflexi bacterium]|nr:hypothetical protein [Chloroflexota bacterium]
MKKSPVLAIISFLAAALLGLTAVLGPLGVSIAQAQEPSSDIMLTTSFPSVVIDKGKNPSFSIEVANKGQQWRSVDLTITSSPDGWNPVLKSGGNVVRKISVAPAKSQYVDFSAKPPADVKPQDYEFVLRASGDGVEPSILRLNVGIQDKVLTKGVSLLTQYPVLRGSSKNKFEFKLDLKNEGDEETLFNLASQAPDGWEVSFQPSYESKQISTIRVKAGETSGINVQVTPLERSEAGEYPIEVTASAGGDRATANLKVGLTGTFGMSVSTSSGRLNAQATAGSATTTSIIVLNMGSAELKDVSFSSTKPDGWTITFNPEKLDSVPMNTTREVNVTIKPSEKAIAGDYVVSISASNAQTSDRKEFRVTVETPTTWGWVGVVIVVAVVAGLVGVFRQLSRR